MNLVRRELKDCSVAELDRLEKACFEGDRISRRSFRRFLRTDSAEGTGIYQGEKLIGYCLLLFRRNSRKARFYSLAVDPGSRDLGIGRQLMQSGEQLAKSRGCTVLQLEVAESNLKARKLYVGLGFELHSRRSAYYEDGQDALVYRKNLRIT